MIILNSDFELVEVAGEYMLVPVGDVATTLNGIIVLSEAAGFLLKQLKNYKNKEELVAILTKEYNIDIDTAEKDVDNWLDKLIELGAIKVSVEMDTGME